MSRVIVVGAAQLGPIQRAHTRQDVLKRLMTLMAEAASRSCDVVVFPELALTTFSHVGSNQTSLQPTIFMKLKCRLQ